MNFDPFDSVAWKSFNMLDDDEGAHFDEAMRHDPVLQSACLEMDRLAAAIAVTLAQPVEPGANQIDRLQHTLRLKPTAHSHLWLAISGWSTAAVLAIVLTLNLTGIIDQWNLPSSTTQRSPTNAKPSNATPNNAAAATAGFPDTPPPDLIAAYKVESLRLNQEIAVLRKNIEQLQSRDWSLFQTVPGMALPIVMTMNPPGMVAEDPAIFVKSDEHSPLTSLLGDALTGLTGATTKTTVVTPEGEETEISLFPDHPTAIPIYDAARDLGTLVVNNLPTSAEGEVYNLWVTTKSGNPPVYIGSLPEKSASGAESFDFSLGSTMVLPSGFVLTKDPLDAPASPTENNIVLQGPPSTPH